MNRAINGDTVAVFLFPNNKWRAPEGRFRTKDLDDEVPNDNEEEEDEAETEKKKSAVVPTGRVVGIVKRSLKHYCGILEPPTIKSKFNSFTAHLNFFVQMEADAFSVQLIA
jgi:exosome complex exonuclease DIS3/RRP44